ncbi:MAG TPA: histidine kinase [Chitinophagaceae bacterium]|nr:histidine kinase [Chitinophagaceae bacterium]
MTIKEKNIWPIAIGIGLIYGLILFVFITWAFPEGNKGTLLEFFHTSVTMLISIGCLYLSLFLVKRFTKKLAPVNQYLLMLLISILPFCFTYLCFWVGFRYVFAGLNTDKAWYLGQISWILTKHHLPVSLVTTFLLYHNRLQKDNLEISKIQNALTETQLKNLQRQVDPHFLFNSLNILTALIKMDKERSAVFTQKLSEIYRFFLATQKESLISLKDELKMVDDYFYLISVRFGQAFKLNIKTETSLETSKLYIVPGTLQSLIENAVKHNIADEKSPIDIDIIIQNDSLKVVNKISRKESPNSGLGLSNLETRYLLINKKVIRYGEKEGFFYVEIPLIKV